MKKEYRKEEKNQKNQNRNMERKKMCISKWITIEE